MAIILSGILQQYIQSTQSTTIDQLLIDMITIITGIGINLYFAFTSLHLYLTDFKLKLKVKLLAYKNYLPKHLENLL